MPGDAGAAGTRTGFETASPEETRSSWGPDGSALSGTRATSSVAVRDTTVRGEPSISNCAPVPNPDPAAAIASPGASGAASLLAAFSTVSNRTAGAVSSAILFATTMPPTVYE